MRLGEAPPLASEPALVRQHDQPAAPTSPSNDEADLSAAIEALAQEEAEREFPADVDGPLQPQEWLLRPGLEPEPEPDPAAAD